MTAMKRLGRFFITRLLAIATTWQLGIYITEKKISSY